MAIKNSTTFEDLLKLFEFQKIVRWHLVETKNGFRDNDRNIIANYPTDYESDTADINTEAAMQMLIAVMQTLPSGNYVLKAKTKIASDINKIWGFYWSNPNQKEIEPTETTQAEKSLSGFGGEIDMLDRLNKSGIVPKVILDENIALLKQEVNFSYRLAQLEAKERDLAQREADFKEEVKEAQNKYTNDTEKIKNGAFLALGMLAEKYLPSLIGGAASATLAGAPQPERTECEQAIFEVYERLIDLHHDNILTLENVNELRKYAGLEPTQANFPRATAPAQANGSN